MGGGDGTPLQEVVGRELAQLRLAGKRTEKSLESTTMNIPPVTGILMSVLLVSSGALAGAEAAKPLPLATRGQAAVYTIVRPAEASKSNYERQKSSDFSCTGSGIQMRQPRLASIRNPPSGSVGER